MIGTGESMVVGSEWDRWDKRNVLEKLKIHTKF